MNNGNTIIYFDSDDITDSFKFKEKITIQTISAANKAVRIDVLLKYLLIFWELLKINSF